jgi:hypothetical protein
VFACAASAGAHAGLVPAHLSSEPRLGIAFAVAVLLLLGAAVGLTFRPSDRRVATAVALLLAGLVVAYLLTRTTGLPMLDPAPEALDAVGLATNGVEALGLGLALSLNQANRRSSRQTHLKEVPQ